MSTLTFPAAATGIACLLGALLVPQMALTLWYLGIVRARTRDFLGRAGARAAAADIPAEVVLCLRGCDPTLEHVLEALAGQSHRRWRLHVIVDSVDDPAWPVVHATLARLARTRSPSWTGSSVAPLATRPARGSLKCASLRQALAALDPETSVVALVDADAVVRHDWLLTLVDECMRPGVGAVSGNRWYDPDADAPGAVVRALWNAGAIVQMAIFGIPWGGSLAVRREAWEACGWRDVLESSLCEDTSLAAPLAAAGWTYRYVPALTAVDTADTVAIRPLTRWIARQLLTARLHHPMWPWVVVHGVSTSLVLVAAAVGVVIAACAARHQAMATIGGALLAYEAANALMLLAFAPVMRAAAAAAGHRVRPLTLGRTCRWAALIPLTQAVYAAALIEAMRCRSVEWRGVVYEIRRAAGRAEVVIT